MEIKRQEEFFMYFLFTQWEYHYGGEGSGREEPTHHFCLLYARPGMWAHGLSRHPREKCADTQALCATQEDTGAHGQW